MTEQEKVREEIESWFLDNVDCEDSHFFPLDKARRLTISILSLPTLREMMEKATETCEWTKDVSITAYRTSCGNVHGLDWDYPMCPNCGLKIKVKDEGLR